MVIDGATGSALDKGSHVGSGALVAWGRSLRMDDEARDTIEKFHEALNRRDLGALSDLITDDCVFEATSPAPDGTRHVGRQAVLEACRVFFAGSPATHLRLRRCSARVTGSSSDGSTAGRMGMSAVLTCCGSGLGGWRRPWPMSRADQLR